MVVFRGTSFPVCFHGFIPLSLWSLNLWPFPANWPFGQQHMIESVLPIQGNLKELSRSCYIQWWWFGHHVWLCELMEFSPSGSSIHEISQAKILEWVVTSFSRGSSWPRDRTCISCIAGIFFHCWVTRETLHNRTVGKQKKVSAFQKESLNILMTAKKKYRPYCSFLVRAVSFFPLSVLP